MYHVPTGNKTKRLKEINLKVIFVSFYRLNGLLGLNRNKVYKESHLFNQFFSPRYEKISVSVKEELEVSDNKKLLSGF